MFGRNFPILELQYKDKKLQKSLKPDPSNAPTICLRHTGGLRCVHFEPPASLHHIRAELAHGDVVKGVHMALNLYFRKTRPEASD